MKEQKQGVMYAYATSDEGEVEWEGAFDTEEEAIADARARRSDLDLTDDELIIIEGRWIEPDELFDTDGFLENAIENLEDLGDENARENLMVSTEAWEEFTEMFGSWLKKNVTCQSYCLDGPKKKVKLEP